MKPRWKRGVELVAGEGTGFGALGDAIGELYVQKYFKPEAKAQMDELVQNLLKAFEQSIDELTWMTDATKEKAKRQARKDRHQDRLHRRNGETTASWMLIPMT